MCLFSITNLKSEFFGVDAGSLLWQGADTCDSQVQGLEII